MAPGGLGGNQTREILWKETVVRPAEVRIAIIFHQSARLLMI
jgi:hypothetical protein